MFFFRAINLATFTLILITGCKGMSDDLLPSHQDKRAPTSQTTSNQPSILLKSTTGLSVVLPDIAIGKRGVVLYFTMWCPVCATDTDHLITQVIPKYPMFDYYVIDYVSGDYIAAALSQTSAGYGNAPFSVLADPNQLAVGRYRATMSSLVVLNSKGVVVMNEGFKNGVRLEAVLQGL